MKTSIFLALLFACIIQAAKPKRKVDFTKVECPNQSPELLQVNCHIKQNSQNISALYVVFELGEDFFNLDGNFSLSILHGKILFNYANLDLDCCTVMKIVQKQYLVQGIINGIRKASNLPLNCPFKKNKQYYIRGFTLDPKLIPSYLPEVTFRVDGTLTAKGRELAQFFLFGGLGQ